MDVAVLAPKRREDNRALTQDEKNIRWALNKFFYTTKKQPLMTAYTMMLKEKYCDGLGMLAAVRIVYTPGVQGFPLFSILRPGPSRNNSRRPSSSSRGASPSHQGAAAVSVGMTLPNINRRPSS